MRDLAVCTSAIIPILAQTPDQATWERLGIAGVSTGIMIYIWRYFIAREEARAIADAADKNRLLEQLNKSQDQVVNLLQAQIVQADRASTALVNAQRDNAKMQEDHLRSMKDLMRKIPPVREVEIVNTPDNPAHMTLDGRN